jgi:3-hydroxyisobutyrate dehydrogenase-like beta-hydroxyacid dehydrogenase
MHTMPTVGVLHPGAMGAALAEVVREAGARVLWLPEGRSRETAARAAAAGLEPASSLRDLASASEVVLSICPPAAAEEVAGAVLAAGFAGIYVDANAISPARAQRIAARVRAAGATPVDGAVIGPPPREPGTRLYLSGAGEAPGLVARLVGHGRVRAVVLPGGEAAASALKMAYAGANKIGLALAAQALALASYHGVADALAVESAELPEGHPLADPARLLRAASKAWRWAPEMDEIGDACLEAGLPDGAARAAADLFARMGARRDSPAESVAQIVADLLGERD